MSAEQNQELITRFYTAFAAQGIIPTTAAAVTLKDELGNVIATANTTT